MKKYRKKKKHMTRSNLRLLKCVRQSSNIEVLSIIRVTLLLRLKTLYFFPCNMLLLKCDT